MDKDTKEIVREFLDNIRKEMILEIEGDLAVVRSSSLNCTKRKGKLEEELGVLKNIKVNIEGETIVIYTPSEEDIVKRMLEEAYWRLSTSFILK